MTDVLERLNFEYERMQREDEPHERGSRLERFMHDLLDLSGLDPRPPYSLSYEQIDGSFCLDGTDYLLEAKWWQGPVQRDQADTFAAKIRRKGRNTMGLFVAVNGFTKGFLHSPHDGGTPFIAATGHDLEAVLDRSVELPQLLRRKRRHLNETGECLLPFRSPLRW